MARRLIWTLFISCCFILGITAQGVASEYDHTVTAEKMTFSWSIQNENLAGKVTAKTESWVGVGFNPTDKMKDANFIVGYVKGKKIKITDDYGQTATGHKSDKKFGGTDDVTLVSATEEKGITTLEFIIPLDSGDKMDKPLDINGDTILLLAYGKKRDSLKENHKFRTSMIINLSTGEVK